jgi:hypothetical protein
MDDRKKTIYSASRLLLLLPIRVAAGGNCAISLLAFIFAKTKDHDGLSIVAGTQIV